MRCLVAVVLVAAGCGRLNFDGLGGVDPTGDGGSRDSADGASGDGPPGSCGAIVEMNDDFNDGAADGRWELKAQTPMSVDEAGNNVHFVYADNVVGTVYANYFSTATYDLGACAMQMRIVQPPTNTVIGPEVGICLTAEDTPKNKQLCANLSSGDLVAYYNTGGVTQYHVETYDPVAFAYVRMYLDSGANQFVWETSPDGVTWNEFDREVPPLALVNLHVELVAGTFAQTPNPGDARIDDLLFTNH